MCRWSILIVCVASAGVAVAEVHPPANVRFAEAGKEVPDFQRHVVPLLGRLGCNSRNCHGSFQGRGDLRLSLFGYDFAMDHAALSDAPSDGSTPSRLDRQQPVESLVLRKPLGQLDHEGGERFESGSWEHHLLRQWIHGGAQGAGRPQELVELTAEPGEIVFGDDQDSVILRVVAHWRDGTREDVTPLCRFRANDDSVVEVDPDGRVTSLGKGDTHVIAFYDNGVAAVPVMRPLHTGSTASASGQGALAANSTIDRLVNEKLAKLGIRPSELATDVEFLRRVSLDLTGTLPAPDEVESFLADTRSDKRQRKIDELIERPAYAAWWANKLCDFTGCNPNQQAELGQEVSVQWYTWIYQRLRENTPYDELVARVVLARGRAEGQSYRDYAAETSAYFRAEPASDFAERPSMPHYWTRRSMQDSEEAAQAFAHNFLGIRLQCAQCHKHPFAPWTQEDFQQFSRFFDSVEYGVAPESRESYAELAQRVGVNVRNASQGEAIRPDVLRRAEQGDVVPWRELYVAKRDEAVSLSLLRSGQVELEPADDPREPIMQWMRGPQNPWFARSLVNRVWAAYFHVGIIDPPDDLNPANPPSNPQLLDWLTQSFIDHGFDLKWLHREIVSSHTYQRSWRPNETNRDDRRNYSRHVPRRMPAEVVYDSVKQALAADQMLDEVRLDLSRRAIGHLSMRLAGTYAMQVYGKPDRVANCDCERVNTPTLLQSVFLQNDPLIDQRLQESGWLQAVARQQEAGEAIDHRQLVREAWLRTLNRPPTAEESARTTTHLQQAESAVEGLRDLLWALINTKEFILLR